MYLASYLEVHHEQIDSQHKELVNQSLALINALDHRRDRLQKDLGLPRLC